MNEKNHPIRAIVFTLLTLTLVCVGLPAHAQAQKPLPYVNDKGEISMPKGFREKMVYIGAWSLQDQMHEVYTQPESLAAYRKTGKFPDGTVLVKEVRAGDSGLKTTGQVRWAKDQDLQCFVMVKDDYNRFPDNPLWKDGWGWALFKADEPMKQVATSYATDCQACHVPAAATDHVFTEGYPILRLHKN